MQHLYIVGNASVVAICKFAISWHALQNPAVAVALFSTFAYDRDSIIHPVLSEGFQGLLWPLRLGVSECRDFVFFVSSV